MNRVLTLNTTIINRASGGLGTSIVETMRLVVYLSLDAATVITGKLASPIWDLRNNLRKRFR